MENQETIERVAKQKKYSMTEALAEIKVAIEECQYLDTTFFCKKTQRTHQIVHKVLEREYFIDDKGIKWVKLAE